MTITSKTIIYIACLPLLSVFSFFQRKCNLNKSHRRYIQIIMISVMLTSGLFLHLPQAQGALFENMAIDTKAISQANTVTADPPGIASIHYNPAGLSLMGDGGYVAQGLLIAQIKKTGKFENDPDNVGFHDFNGDKIEDPIAGKEAKLSNAQIYLPVINTTLELPVLPAPLSGFSYRKPGSKWTFGFTMYAKFAGGWTFDGDDPAIYGGRGLYVQHIAYANPAISYKVNNNLSIGATFAAGQTAMGANMTMRAPNEIVNITKILGDATKDMANPLFDVTIPMPLFGGGIGVYDDIGDVELAMRDDFSPSYHLGALWEPLDWLSLGLCYQSALKATMSGKFSFKYSEDWQRMVSWSGSTAIMQIASMIFDLPYTAVEKQTGAVSTTMEFPQMINIGFKIKPTSRLSLLGDMKWAEWSIMKDTVIKFDQKIQLLQMAKFMGYPDGPYTMKMPRKFDDTLDWGFGMTYQLLDWVELRAGYEHRTSPVQDNLYDLMFDLPSMNYYGTGLGIKWGDMDIDLALGYMKGKPKKIPAGYSDNLNSYILGAGLNTSYRGLSYEPKMDVLLVSFNTTVPLEYITDNLFDLLPASWGGAKDKIDPKFKLPVDSSVNMIGNMRYENKFYFIEDSV